MKTLIVYYSKYGTGDRCTELMKKDIQGEVVRTNLRTKDTPDPEGYDRIILGSSIHAGRVASKIKRFASTYLEQLLQKETGLFLCCLAPEDRARDYYGKNFPHALVEHAKARGVLGGALYFEKMNFFERFLLKKIVGSGENQENINPKRISQFVADFEA